MTLPSTRSRSLSHSRSITPPHQPLYNIQASEDSVRLAVLAAFPLATFISSEQLPHGSSFNNRIYIVRVRDANSKERELIYKVSGWAWDRIKTLNEVMCLKLVEKWCPELPVPRVISWCNDRGAPESEGNEWILMERLPGELVASLQPELSDEERDLLIVEYAKIVAVIRTKTPNPGYIGAVVDVTESGKAVLGDTALNTAATGAPWKTFVEYYSALLNSEVRLLETNPVYKSATHLIPLLYHFVVTTIPSLPIFQDRDASQIVFTHNDLADRNILIARSSSHGLSDPSSSQPEIHITGLIDFEFSGFFPFFEDFVSLSSEPIFGISPSKDEQNPGLESLFSHMERLGCMTPKSPAIIGHWRTAVLLRQVLDNAAPWWIRGKEPSEEVEEELVEPIRLVQEALEELAEHHIKD